MIVVAKPIFARRVTFMKGNDNNNMKVISPHD
jgi:hypothetical protein